MMKEIKTYITYFDDDQIKEYNLKEDENTVLFKGNDVSYSGESINNLNTFYCELCTMYYVWKNNLKSDYVVLRQYRRPFNWEEVGKLPEEGDIICYEGLETQMPVIFNYAVYHGKRRANDLLHVMADLFGNNSDEVKYFQRGMILYTNNTFVMKWEDFCKMCEFVFGVTESIDRFYKLNHLYDRYMVNARKYVEDGRDEYQTHWMAYIGERLVSCYIATKMKPITIPRLENNGFYSPYKKEETQN